MAKVQRFFVIEVTDTQGEKFSIELDEREFDRLYAVMDDQYEENYE